MMGPIEDLVLRAWGLGVHIDATEPRAHGVALVDLVCEARGLQGEMKPRPGHCLQFGRGCGMLQEGGQCVCTCQKCLRIR
jgi:hypothetical protein